MGELGWDSNPILAGVGKVRNWSGQREYRSLLRARDGGIGSR